MKRRAILLCAALLALLLLGGTARAADSGRRIDLVTDAAGLLTQSQRARLEARAEELSERYGCDIAIVAVSSLDGYEPAEFNEAVYEQYALGRGAEKSGVCLLLSMENRDYDLLARGSAAAAFTDYGKRVLSGRFLDYFHDDDWYGGFLCYLDTCGEFLQYAAGGAPVDKGADPYDRFTAAEAAVTLAVCFLPGLAAVLVMKRRMKTAVTQTQADAYVAEDGVTITENSDVYLSTTQSRVRRARASSESSGGGGAHEGGKF